MRRRPRRSGYAKHYKRTSRVAARGRAREERGGGGGTDDTAVDDNRKGNAMMVDHVARLQFDYVKRSMLRYIL